MSQTKTEAYKATTTKSNWILLDESIRLEQKGLEKRSDPLPAGAFGSLRGEIDNSVNGHDEGDLVGVCMFDEEILIARKHAEAAKIELSWEELP